MFVYQICFQNQHSTAEDAISAHDNQLSIINLVPLTSKTRVMHSAEEDNLSPFDSKSLPCASTSNNK